MAKKTPPVSVDQTAQGSDNIQVAGNQNIITRITNFFQGDTKGQLEQRNRRVMLDHVENFWVRGVLEKSLHGAALLELGIKEDPSAVSYPWTIRKESTNETLPAGKSMLEIFQEIGMGRSLLILGAPGSGKTTMLLELARGLIQQAREDASEPIPVVFNLASWTENQTLGDWLAEQLNLVYSVPRKIAPTWVTENRMLLLLDGLDEVQGERRGKCVDAINQFRKENGLTSLVVCSRSEEYSMLNTKLSLQGAIVLQPLTSEQINAYFDTFGRSFIGVKQLLNKDKVLQELTGTPLILSIIVLAYKNRNADELIVSGDLEAQRAHLFDTYIARMFERSNSRTHIAFSKQQTLCYLHWLAAIMNQHNIVTYQIEAMQPSWLKRQPQNGLYRLYAGLFFGLMFGLIGGLFGGLIGGLLFGLLGAFLGGATNRITMVDRLKWSLEQARSRLLFGLSIGPFFGLFLLCAGGLLVGLLAGLTVWLFFGLVGGLTSEQVEETTYPGQRLKQTLLNNIFLTLLGGVIFGLPTAMMYGGVYGLIYGLLLGAGSGLIFGLMGGFLVGYLPFIQHYALRLVLAQNHFLPRQLIPFLEYCTSLIFLRRVGGGYIFVHRLLMEHFAEMDA